METKTIKRKRLNIARTLIFILVIYILVCIGVYIYKEPVKHYEISGNKTIKDVEILRSLGIENYPSYVSVPIKKLEQTLESNPLIKEAKVRYGLDFAIEIDIVENDPMFIVKSDNTVCLEDGAFIEYSNEFVGLPVLLNTPTEEIMKLLAKNLGDVDQGVRIMISEIEYQPSYNSANKVIDANRFLLSMKDKNLVYITAKKAKRLNEYLDMIAVKKITSNGTFYLDGNGENYPFNQFDVSTTTTTKEPTTTKNTTQKNTTQKNTTQKNTTQKNTTTKKSTTKSTTTTKKREDNEN